MGPLRVQPENGRLPGEPGTVDAKPDPVLNGGVLGLTHPKDVVLLNALFHQRGARCVHHLHRPVAGRFESLVVGTVLLRRLRHQPHIGHAANGGGVKGAMLLAILNHRLVDGRIRAVGNHRDGVVQFVVRPPRPPAVADDYGH